MCRIKVKAILSLWWTKLQNCLGPFIKPFGPQEIGCTDSIIAIFENKKKEKEKKERFKCLAIGSCNQIVGRRNKGPDNLKQSILLEDHIGTVVVRTRGRRTAGQKEKALYTRSSSSPTYGDHGTR